MPKQKLQTGLPQVHEDLKGYNLNIDAFGEVRSNFDIERINEFLNKPNIIPETKKSAKNRGRKHNNDQIQNKNGND